MHYENKILGEINLSNDIEFVKEKYTQLLESKKQYRIEKNEIINKNLTLLSVSFFMLVINLVILIMELAKRRKNDLPTTIKSD